MNAIARTVGSSTAAALVAVLLSQTTAAFNAARPDFGPTDARRLE